MISITGDGVNITQANVKDLSIDNYYADGQVVQFGTAISSELSLFLKGSFDLDGKELAVTVDNNLRGYFTVDEVKRTRMGMTLSALDRMVKLDKAFEPIALPTTLTSLVTDACAKCGVPFGSVAFRANSSLAITDLPTDCTYRDILMWIGEITGTCSHIGSDGKLYMRWYTGSYTISPSIYYEGGEFTAEQISVTGYKYKDTQVGTDGFVVEFNNNRLLDLVDIESVLDNLPFDSYYPFNVDTKEIVLNPLTLATFKDYDDEEYPTLVTHYNYKYRKKSKVSAVGKSMTELGRKKINPLTPSQQQIISTLKDNIEISISDKELMLLSLNEQINNSVGLYVTEHEGKIYQHDKELLSESLYITTQTSGGFAWTTEGWNDGEPIWNYGVDVNGNAILNILSVTGIIADWIKTGRIESQDGSSFWSLDSAEFNLGDMLKFYKEGGKYKLEINLADPTKNLVLKSNEEIDFGEQSDIATTVQDFEGRNFIQPEKSLIGIMPWSYDRATNTFSYVMDRADNRTYMNTSDYLNQQDFDVVTLSGYFKLDGNPLTKADYRAPDRGEVSDMGTKVSQYLDEETGYFEETYTSPSTTMYVVYSKNRLVLPQGTLMEIIDFKEEKGYEATPYQPAPEDLEYAYSYDLSSELTKQTYTISVDDTDSDDWVGLWLGDNHFAGYFEDNKLTFEGIEGVDEIIIKSLTGETIIKEVMLVTGDKAGDWALAPQEQSKVVNAVSKIVVGDDILISSGQIKLEAHSIYLGDFVYDDDGVPVTTSGVIIADDGQKIISANSNAVVIKSDNIDIVAGGITIRQGVWLEAGTGGGFKYRSGVRFIRNDGKPSESVPFLIDDDAVWFYDKVRVEDTLTTKHIKPIAPGLFNIGESLNRYSTIYCNNVINTSDRRAKSDIREVTDGDILDFISKVQAYTYVLKGSESVEQARAQGKLEDIQMGLIAQDIREHKLFDYVGFDNGKDEMALKYNALTSVALQGVKILQDKVSSLEERIKRLEEVIKCHMN